MSSIRDQYFMKKALEQARVAYSLGEVPIGAVVVRGDEVVAAAHNLREALKDPSAHAEFIAIEAASLKEERWRLSDMEVYVTLEPCLMCAGLMINSRVKRCVFGTRDPKGGALGSLYTLAEDERLNHSFEVVEGVLEKECSEILQMFFRELRQTKKRLR